MIFAISRMLENSGVIQSEKMGLYLNMHVANSKNNIEKLLTIVFSASTDTSINELVVKIKFAFKMLIFMSDDTIHVEVTFTLETATFETI